MAFLTRERKHKIKVTLLDWVEYHETLSGRLFGYFLVVLIGLSTAFFIIETTSYGPFLKPYFWFLEVFIWIAFVFEYLLRFCLSKQKIRFVFSFMSLIDFLVIMAFALSLFTPAAFRAFRVLKILQLLKIVRYSEVLVGFWGSLKNYKNEFTIFWTTLGIGILLGSSAIYFLEYKVNPSISSIPDAMWFTIVSISTVGYGDITPMTIEGKILVFFMIFGGLAMSAILTAIITKVFMEHFFDKRKIRCVFCSYPKHDFDARYCKNCGSELESNYRRDSKTEE